MVEPHKHWTPEDSARFEELWISGLRLKVIAAEMGFSMSTLSFWRRRLGLKKGRPEVVYLKPKVLTRLQDVGIPVQKFVETAVANELRRIERMKRRG